MMKSSDEDTHFMHKVNQTADRKLKAQRQAHKHVWQGLGMMGIVGWSVAVPTLLGLTLGLWMDNAYPGAYAWTLNLLLLGMIVGCFIAWHWVSKEYTEMNSDEDEHK
jgi:ATP synthase protein I